MTQRRLIKRITIHARASLIPMAAALLLGSAFTGAAAAQTPSTDTSRPAGSASPAGAGAQPTPSVPAAAATVTPPAPVTAPATTAASPAVPSLDKVLVREVYRLGYLHSADHQTRSSAGIGDIIVVKVDELKSLVNYAKCLTIDERPIPAGCQKQELALYLDGREIKGIQPESGAPMPADQTLQFHLDRNDDSDEAWADLLGAPRPSSRSSSPARRP